MVANPFYKSLLRATNYENMRKINNQFRNNRDFAQNFSVMNKVIACAVFIIALSCQVSADDESDKLACCLPSYYIRNRQCWEPINNVTEPLRVDCNDSIRVWNFKIQAGKLRLQFSEMYSYTANSSV